jgi:muramoyltetrapeptide carboxypeptidase
MQKSNFKFTFIKNFEMILKRLKLLILGLCTFFLSFDSLGQNDVEQTITRDLIRPPSLKKGDTIMILSPAGKVSDRSAVDPGIELANHWGLVVFFGDHLLSVENSFAGSDDDRLEDLQSALDDSSIKAIWASRGGYGTVRIIDNLDFSAFVENPKWIIGYSDITVLHNKIHSLGFESIHGQMPLTLNLDDPVQKESIKSLHAALFGKKLQYKIKSSPENRTGSSTGQLVGGNLSIVYSMLDSDTNLNMDGKILFIEDIGERLYHIDRMMISLKRAGYFKNCKGLILGDFRIKPNEGNPFGKTLEDIVKEATEGTDFPVVFGFPAGHLDDNRALKMGSYIDLEAGKKNTKVRFR